jgi:hypothetical protein
VIGPMSTHAMRGSKPNHARVGVIERLRQRQLEIVEAIVARIHNVAPDPVSDGDVQYEDGQRAACVGCVEYALTGLEQGHGGPAPIPTEAIAQAQRAARSGVALETLLLRLTAGHRLFGDFVMDEARNSRPQALREVVSLQWSLFERLVSAVSLEYRHETDRAERTDERALMEHVRRLLAGEPGDLDDFGYNVDAHHVAVITAGPQAKDAARGLRATLDCPSLLVACDEDTVWVWFGGHPRGLAALAIPRAMSALPKHSVAVAVGEPARALDGWRLTHRQAQEALRVALHRPWVSTPYSEVMLEAALLRDRALARALVQQYLSPLDQLRIGGTVARETLRAYFSCGRNASSAAHLLGVGSRHTVTNRLREIEKILDRQLPNCLTELEVALRLEALGVVPPTNRTATP